MNVSTMKYLLGNANLFAFDLSILQVSSVL